MPRRASLPEGKSLFFRRTAEEPEQEVQPVAPPAAPAERARHGDGESGETQPTTRSERGTTATRQSAIFLEERHLDWLEDKCREARQQGGRAIRKAFIIRALLDVAMESPVDLTALRKDDDLLARVRQGLRGA